MTNSVAQKMGSPRFNNSITRAKSEELKWASYCQLVSTGGNNGGSCLILPMPVSVSSNTGVSWEQSDAGLKAMLSEGKSSTDTAKDMISAGLAETDRRAVEMIASGILGQGGDKAYQKRAGSLINPAQENYFRGSDCRNIQLVFNLIPLSSEDTEVYRMIIHLLQKNSVPSVPNGQAGRIMHYPSSWQIDFKPDRFLPVYKEAVLTNVTTDYSATGKTYLHDDGGPVQINLSLNFTELTILTREDVEGGIYG